MSSFKIKNYDDVRSGYRQLGSVFIGKGHNQAVVISNCENVLNTISRAYFDIPQEAKDERSDSYLYIKKWFIRFLRSKDVDEYRIKKFAMKYNIPCESRKKEDFSDRCFYFSSLSPKAHRKLHNRTKK